MGIIQRNWNKLIKWGNAPFIDEAPQENDDRITMKDMLRFVEKQSEQNNLLIRAVLEQGASQARTMESYIELFKPRTVASTTLEEREKMKSDKVEVRESEWEGIDSIKKFNELTAGMDIGIPPELSEF